MPSTSSQRPGSLHRVPAPAGPDGLRLEVRPPARLDGRHVLVVAPGHDPERLPIRAHTDAICEHLAGSAASVTVQRRAGTAGERLAEALPGALPGPLARPLARSLARSLTRPVAPAPHLVVAVTPGLRDAVAGARIAGRHGVPLVLVVHDLVSARPAGRYGPGGLRMAEATERRLLPRATEVAVVNPDLGAVVRALGVPARHVHLLPQWTALPAADRDRAAARRALGWPLRPFTVVHPVGVDRAADPATVLATAGLLDRSVRLVLTGEGARRAASRTPSAAADVRVETATDDASRRLVLAAADLVLVAQRTGTAGPCVPQVLVDCLGAGRPVLAAAPPDCAVAAELDRAAGAGLVVRPGDPALLAAAVRALRLDDDLRAAMGAAALRHARSRLDRREAMRRLDGIVEAALGTARPAGGTSAR